MMEKKGVSPVIATVLLLVLTLVIVSILAAFVVPFVQNSLKGSESCLEVLDGLKFDETGYGCYIMNSTTYENRTGISVQINNDNILGFKAVLFRQGDSEPFDITQGASGEDFARMLGANFDLDPMNPLFLDVPSRGGVRTYVFNGTYDRADIHPIIKSGKPCEVSDSINLQRCASPSVISGLLEY